MHETEALRKSARLVAWIEQRGIWLPGDHSMPHYHHDIWGKAMECDLCDGAIPDGLEYVPCRFVGKYAKGIHVWLCFDCAEALTRFRREG